MVRERIRVRTRPVCVWVECVWVYLTSERATSKLSENQKIVEFGLLALVTEPTLELHSTFKFQKYPPLFISLWSVCVWVCGRVEWVWVCVERVCGCVEWVFVGVWSGCT